MPKAEKQLMARISTAGPEIEHRIRQWLTARLLYVHEVPDVHVLPACALWQPSCGEAGLTSAAGRPLHLVERRSDHWPSA